MSSLAKYWPTIRQVAYGLLAAALAVAAGAGWITDEQSTQWLNHAVTLLGAIGFVVAGLFVDRTSAAQESKIEEAVRSGLEQTTQTSTGGAGGDAGWLPGGGGGGVFRLPDVRVPYPDVPSMLERVRAEAERRLNGR